MPKDTRDKVTLSPEAYKALEVEAMLHGTSLKDTASKLILKAACPKCKEILDIMARPPKGTREEGPNGPLAQGTNKPNVPLRQNAEMDDLPSSQDRTMPHRPDAPKCQSAKVPKGPRAKLSNDPMALAKLKELYRLDPRPSLRELATQLGYSKSTVSDNIRKMKEKGELE
jgi:hypothetical protein